MQITFTGRNIEITPALKQHTEEKLQRLQHRHESLGQIHVTLHIENVTHTAEATTRLYGIELHASAEADDMYEAIDLLVDKLEKLINKQKEKITDHR